MSSYATLPAAAVAAAANAYAQREREKFRAPDGMRVVNHVAMYDAEALTKLAEAAALTGGTISVSRDDFRLIEADFAAVAGGSPST